MPAVGASAVVAATLCIGLGILALGAAGWELWQFTDPCHAYGATGQEETVGPEPGCRSVSATSETKGQVVLRLLWVHGTAVVAAILAGLGLRDARFFWPAGGLLVALSFPLLLGIAWTLTLPAGIAALVAARRGRREPLRGGGVPGP